jgi:hypothetical protein
MKRRRFAERTNCTHASGAIAEVVSGSPNGIRLPAPQFRTRALAALFPDWFKLPDRLGRPVRFLVIFCPGAPAYGYRPCFLCSTSAHLLRTAGSARLPGKALVDAASNARARDCWDRLQELSKRPFREALRSGTQRSRKRTSRSEPR